MPSPCATCGKAASLICSWCKLVHYCSKQCQKRGWKTHKKNCAWSLDKDKAQKKQEEESKKNEPDFIQTAPGIWYHPGRPWKSRIEMYREIATIPYSPENTPEPIITTTHINSLASFIHHLPSLVSGQRLSATIISFRCGPLETIDSESLRIIIAKSVNRWINVSDSIISNICSFHYGYQPFNAAHLIIGLLSEYQSDNQLLCRYLRDAKSSYGDDIEYDEELFESQKRLRMENVKICIDESTFKKVEPQFIHLVNYMNANFYDCHIMTNHITDDSSFFHDLYVFIVGVTENGGLKGILLNSHDPEGDVW